MTVRIAPVLLFTWGNPSRGDDALGPALHDRLLARRAAGHLPDVDLLTDFQLQVEHALDLRDRERVVFADASVDAPAPFEFRPLQPEREVSFTTHAMSPGAILAVFEQVERRSPPPAFLLSVRGYRFGLGQPLSDQAQRHLEQASDFLVRLFTGCRDGDWPTAGARGPGR